MPHYIYTDFIYAINLIWKYILGPDHQCDQAILIITVQQQRNSAAFKGSGQLCDLRCIFVAATALQLLPWCLSSPYWTHIMHHGEDSNVSYIIIILLLLYRKPVGHRHKMSIKDSVEVIIALKNALWSRAFISYIDKQLPLPQRYSLLPCEPQKL